MLSLSPAVGPLFYAVVALKPAVGPLFSPAVGPLFYTLWVRSFTRCGSALFFCGSRRPSISSSWSSSVSAPASTIHFSSNQSSGFLSPRSFIEIVFTQSTDCLSSGLLRHVFTLRDSAVGACCGVLVLAEPLRKFFGVASCNRRAHNAVHCDALVSCAGFRSPPSPLCECAKLAPRAPNSHHLC